MALPVLETPSFHLEVPSTKKKIKYRPFLVKEEKILLIALQDGGEDTIFTAVKDIIANCTFNEVDIDKLTTYDLEWIFLQIRIKSKGSDVPLYFKCTNQVPVAEDGPQTKECGHTNEVILNLEDVIVTNTENISNKIMIDENKQIGLIMSPPTFETSKLLTEALQKNDVQAIYDTLPNYVDTVFQGEQTFDEFTAKEFREFVDSMSDTQFEKIQNYFDNIPKLRAELEVVCAACGHKETIVLEGLSSFLGL